MTTTITDTLADRIRRLIDNDWEWAARLEIVTAVVCPRGDHLRVAQRWRWRCERCQQPIDPGAVGPATWDDDRTCGVGGYSFQHGCGEWNSPVEVTVDLDAYDDDLPDAADPDRGYKLDDVAKRVLGDALTRLDTAVAAQVVAEVEAVSRRLAGDLRHVLTLVDGLPPGEAMRVVRDVGLHGDDTSPGVYHDGEGWVAWDYHPHAFTEDTITVTQADVADRSHDA